MKATSSAMKLPPEAPPTLSELHIDFRFAANFNGWQSSRMALRFGAAHDPSTEPSSNEGGSNPARWRRKGRSRIAQIACGILAGLPLAALSAPWDFGVDVDLGVIFTDNVLLAPDGQEQNETVYTVVPEFYLTREDPRINANLRYRPEAYFYSEFSESDNVFHALDASLSSALISDRLNLDLNAVRSQTILSPDFRFPSSNLPIIENRGDSTSLSISPSWQQAIGQLNLLLDVDYMHTEYDTDFNGDLDPTFNFLQSNDQYHGVFNLGNVDRQQGFAWRADYRYDHVEYNLSIPWEFQRASLDLGFWLNGILRIFVVGGAETAFDNIRDSNLDADFWEAGIQYRPNARLDAVIAVGDRSYGESYRGSVSYRMRRGQVTLNYSEGPTTRAVPSFERRPILDTDVLNTLLNQPGASDRYVQKRGDLVVDFELARSTLSLRAFSEQRERRTTSEGAALDELDYSGLAARWNWNVGNKTTIGVGGDFGTRKQFRGDGEFKNISADIGYLIGSRSSISLVISHATQEGKESSLFDYSENVLRILFGIQL